MHAATNDGPKRHSSRALAELVARHRHRLERVTNRATRLRQQRRRIPAHLHQTHPSGRPDGRGTPASLEYGHFTELLAGRFGDDSEVVVKRCAGRLLGLPPESFQDVPIRELAKRFKAAAPAPAPAARRTPISTARSLPRRCTSSAITRAGMISILRPTG